MIIRVGRVNFLISFKAKEQRTIVHSVFHGHHTLKLEATRKKKSRGWNEKTHIIGISEQREFTSCEVIFRLKRHIVASWREFLATRSVVAWYRTGVDQGTFPFDTQCFLWEKLEREVQKYKRKIIVLLRVISRVFAVGPPLITKRW